MGCASVVLFAASWAMAQNEPLSTPPAGTRTGPDLNPPAAGTPGAIGSPPNPAPRDSNAPLHDPHRAAPGTNAPLTPPSATIPDVGPPAPTPVPTQDPAAKPSPKRDSTAPSALPNPDDAGSLPPLPPPVSTVPTVPQGPANNDGGIPPNTFGHLGITVVQAGNDDGVVVTGIERTSPAYPAGLLIADQIVAINGQRIAKFDDLVKGLRIAAQGDGNVALLVRRRGTVDTINVMVGGKTAQTERPRLGLTLDDSNGQLLVLEVTPNSPAAVAGVQVGDEIITVNDYPVSTFDLFVGQIQAMGRAGGQIPLGVRRNGKMITLKATLRGSQPPALPKSELPAAESSGGK
jgi:membrane-associated protease RseP (regulator of RpoE activity)